jgi:hypothetical protein
VIAYFLSCDPAACTEDATKNHIRRDYAGHLASCEEVRRNNKLVRDHFTVSGDVDVSGDEADVHGEILLTGETFEVKLAKVDGSWKIDRIRGSQ